MNARSHKTHSRGGGLRVMVTGATGFLGFHTARALHQAGHRLRLLVRSPAKMKRLFEPLGLDNVEHVVGDISDPESVARALDGCEAVVHTAAMINLEASSAIETVQTNRRATELVIGGAAERGMTRIIQVSSITALFSPGRDRIDDQSPLAMPNAGYGRSKVESDLYVRGLQAHGAPVYTIYPGMIAGPEDPGLSEGMRALATQLNLRMSLVTAGGVQIVDVRDLAQAHLKLIERGGPPARYLMGGQYLSWTELADALETLTGRPQRRLRLSSRVVEALATLGETLNPVLPFDLAMTRELALYATRWTPSDDSRTLNDLNLRYRDIKETLGDAVQWLATAGHLKDAAYAAHLPASSRRKPAARTRPSTHRRRPAGRPKR